MDYTQEEIDELIAKELANEASAEEVSRIEQWKRASAENLDYYNESVTLFRHIDSLAPVVNVNVDAAWQKMDQRLSAGDEAKTISFFPNRGMFRIAAAIFLLALLGVVLYSVVGESETTSLNLVAANQVEEKKLPDGSKVVMNKTAEIEFVSNKNRREVKLKGEAYFEVVHNAEQPFVINVDGVFIEDVGTAFNVKALPESDVVEVLVEEGEVRFYTEDLSGISLIKGQSALYDKKTKEFRLVDAVANSNTISYKTKHFQFNATRLGDVIEQLSDVYGIAVQVENNDLLECQVSVMFNNERPEVIMDILAETLSLEVVRNGNDYLLKGAACK